MPADLKFISVSCGVWWRCTRDTTTLPFCGAIRPSTTIERRVTSTQRQRRDVHCTGICSDIQTSSHGWTPSATDRQTLEEVVALRLLVVLPYLAVSTDGGVVSHLIICSRRRLCKAFGCIPTPWRCPVEVTLHMFVAMPRTLALDVALMGAACPLSWVLRRWLLSQGMLAFLPGACARWSHPPSNGEVRIGSLSSPSFVLDTEGHTLMS